MWEGDPDGLAGEASGISLGAERREEEMHTQPGDHLGDGTVGADPLSAQSQDVLGLSLHSWRVGAFRKGCYV